ncbi:hypothetical protein PIB30_104671, partial [Stylosanthes scabra]|nr:hypothetical protein [Stylosanthes scabra]
HEEHGCFGGVDWIYAVVVPAFAVVVPSFAAVIPVLRRWFQLIRCLKNTVLRDSTNASEEIQHEQVSLPLKYVVEE